MKWAMAVLMLTGVRYAMTAEEASPVAHPLHRHETAQVCRLALRGLTVGAARDVTVTLYERAGTFINGYALVAGLPELPWTVNTQPPGRHGLYQQATGLEIEYPDSLMKRYGYHADDFNDIRGRWSKGEIVARRESDPAPLCWNADGTALAGTFDLIMTEDGAGRAGAWIDGAYRIRITAAANASGEVQGVWTAWRYDWRDRTYGASAERREGRMTVNRLPDFWTPRADTAFAPGREWANTHGPCLNMAATDCGRALVSDLNDARLVWVAEEPGGGGKGAINKTPFGVGPLVANDYDAPGYSAPVVADGRVYLFTVFPDFNRLAESPEWRDSILRVRGAPLGSEAFGMFVDRFVCYDARTGRTLWKQDTPFTTKSLKDEKSGRGLTPCVVDGVLVGRGSRGLYGYDAVTGEKLWERPGAGMGATGGPGSREESLVAIGGVALVGLGEDAGTTLAALDPRTGKELWRHPRARGYNAVPSSIILEGEPYILTASCVHPGDKRVKPEARADYERLLLIEPRSGRILWEDHTIGTCGAGLLVSGDLACAQVVPLAGSEKGASVERPGVWRITKQGATKLWALGADAPVHFPDGRMTPLLADGAVFLDSRETGFTATELATGKLRGRLPHLWHLTQGDHNWTWCTAGDGRIITSGMLQFDSRTLRQMGGQFPVALAGGYVCPIKPALADGRLFVRTTYGLVCYDLRADPAREAATVAWEVGLAGGWIGLPDAVFPLRLRSRAGELIGPIGAYPPDAHAAGAPLGRDRRHPRWESSQLAQRIPCDGTRLQATLPVHSGSDRMPFRLDLTRTDNGVTGVWQRSLPGVGDPLRREGTFTVAGPYAQRQYPTPWDKANPFARFGASPSGAVTRLVTLDGFLTKPDEPAKPLLLCLDHGVAGVKRAIGTAFGFSQAWHEVQVQSFSCDADGVAGTLIVILHSDAYTPVAPDEGQQAVRVTLQAAAGATTGAWTAEYGVAWSATGQVR